MLRPEIGEYPTHYLQYIKLLPAGDILEILEQQGIEILEFFSKVSDHNALYRYDADKWCIKEIFLHLIDTERVFAYRALRMSRGDTTPLPTFNQDEFIRNSNVLQRPIADLCTEYQSVRNASLTLFRSLDEEMASRIGTASGNLMTVRTIPCVIAGHELHHLRIIKEKYLTRPSAI
jgi:hypothetical protein